MNNRSQETALKDGLPCFKAQHIPQLRVQQKRERCFPRVGVYSMIAHSALGCGDIFVDLFVDAKLRKSEVDLVLMEQSLERENKLSDVVIAGMGVTSCVWNMR